MGLAKRKVCNIWYRYDLYY